MNISTTIAQYFMPVTSSLLCHFCREKQLRGFLQTAMGSLFG